MALAGRAYHLQTTSGSSTSHVYVSYVLSVHRGLSRLSTLTWHDHPQRKMKSSIVHSVAD